MRRSRQIGIYHARRGSGRHLRTVATVAGVLATLVVAWVAFAFVRPIPAPRLVFTISTHPKIGGAPFTLAPPLGVEEAVSLAGVGTIDAAGGDAPIPIASLTKMMSALVVLRDHPFAIGSSGPSITVTQADVATYTSEAAQSDSVVKVQAGEKLSELQALEGSLVPSGDNLIELLAVWDAGSIRAFVGRMNALAHSLGMKHTHYSGPSGVDPSTVSTAVDQLRLAETAITNPVFASVVAMSQVSLPVAGIQYNVNADLGTDGIDGIKTGWIPQGGGCFVFSAATGLDGRAVTVVGAILGEQGGTPLPTALGAAKRLVLAVEKKLTVFRLPTGSTVGVLTAPYTTPVRVVVTSPIAMVSWSGARLTLSTNISRSSGSVSGHLRVGLLTAHLGSARASASLTSTGPIVAPSLLWRLLHL